MGILIDTSVFIASERGRLSLRQILISRPDPTFAISVITLSELLVGVHRASEERRARREAEVESIASRSKVLPVDESVARVHARLSADLKSRGVPVGYLDLLIAATAIYHDLEVLSLDHHSFPRIPGIKLATPVLD